jgi:starch synthase
MMIQNKEEHFYGKVLIIAPFSPPISIVDAAPSFYLKKKLISCITQWLRLYVLLNRDGVDAYIILPKIYDSVNDQICRLSESIGETLLSDKIYIFPGENPFLMQRRDDESSLSMVKATMQYQKCVIDHMDSWKPTVIQCGEPLAFLISAIARKRGIPCIFTIDRADSHYISLEEVDAMVMDSSNIWPYLFYTWQPRRHEEAYSPNRVDALASSIFASRFINIVPPDLFTILQRTSAHYSRPVLDEILNKHTANCILKLVIPYPMLFDASQVSSLTDLQPQQQLEKKREAKTTFSIKYQFNLQGKAILFWPIEFDIDRTQLNLLLDSLSHFQDWTLQSGILVIFCPKNFHDSRLENVSFQDRFIVVHESDDNRIARMAKIAADIVLAPTPAVSCNHLAITALRDGALPVVFNDAGCYPIEELIIKHDVGNGFIVAEPNKNALFRAFQRVSEFIRLDPLEREHHALRITRDAENKFCMESIAQACKNSYKKALDKQI